MITKYSRLVSVLFAAMLLTSCAGSDYEDIDEFMADVRAQPKPPIDPIPPVKRIPTFAYDSAALRAPFDRPLEQKPDMVVDSGDVEPPDERRVKEHLEKFNLESLSMVGTMEQHDVLWILIQDSNGGVYRVKEGNYLGRNHGRIIEAEAGNVSVLEKVPNGRGSWFERPRTLKLRESD